MSAQKAYFAAGCFWGIQAAFDDVPGVVSTRVGYAGGKTENPTYQEVCSGKTMHAETVEVEYDPEKISYEKLLEEFWRMHDPTQLNMQGPDVGTQYRSAIFYVGEEQKQATENSLRNEQKKTSRQIMTEIKPLKRFFPAEEYHQHYLKKREAASFS